MGQPFLTKAIDNLGPYAIVAQTECRRIVVQENYNSANPPTADLQQFNPDKSGPVAIPKGTPAIFSIGNQRSDGPYVPGIIVGYVNTTGGSITIQQIESYTV